MDDANKHPITGCAVFQLGGRRLPGGVAGAGAGAVVPDGAGGAAALGAAERDPAALQPRRGAGSHLGPHTAPGEIRTFSRHGNTDWHRGDRAEVRLGWGMAEGS